MKIKIHHNPWQHGQVQNFLPDSLLNDCIQYSYRTLTTNKPNASRFIVTEYTDYLMHQKLNTFSKPLFKKFCKKFKIKHQPVDILYFFTNYNNMDSNNIHVDLDWKLLTVICALSHKGNGTDLYKTNLQYVKTTDWKLNSASILPRFPDNYHDVGKSVDTDRISLNITYCKKGCVPEKYMK